MRIHTTIMRGYIVWIIVSTEWRCRMRSSYNTEVVKALKYEQEIVKSSTREWSLVLGTPKLFPNLILERKDWEL